MRVEFVQSIDFNQMLVYSTFAHLLFLTIVMFLPSPKIQEQIVVPTFRLDLIELPSAVKPVSTAGKKKKVIVRPIKKRMAPKLKPIAKKQARQKMKTSKPKPKAKKQKSQKIKTSKPKPKAKLLPPPKPVFRELQTNKKVLADLEALQSSAPKKSILQELDEVARTIAETRAKKVIPPKPMQEETFKEMEKRKIPELPIKPEQAKVSPKPMQEETFKEMEKKKAPELPIKSEKVKVLPLVNDSEVEAQERELAELLKESDRVVQTQVGEVFKEIENKDTPVLMSKSEQTTASDLIKELEAMEKKKTFPVGVPVEQKQPGELNSVPVSKGSNGKSLMSVAEKFKELEESSEEVIMDISQDQMVRREFKTVIQRGEVPATETDEASNALSIFATETDSELEASNALSIFVGRIYKRVYSKWKTPLGAKAKKVVVAFTVFRKGNIDKPVIRESAGDENLDSIAVRAILDSVPFPPLPEELRRPNLRVSIVFKYVSEEK